MSDPTMQDFVDAVNALTTSTTNLMASVSERTTQLDAGIDALSQRADRTLSNLNNVATSRSNLGLGTAATRNTGTSGATVPLLNGANTWAAAQTLSVDATINGVTVGRGGGSLNNTTAVGHAALQSNSTGSGNTAAGFEALQNNTSGNNNTATGREALQHNTTGESNVASGFWALRDNTTGDSNIAVGVSALRGNTTGHHNTAAGGGAGRYAGSGTNANTTSNNSLYLGRLTRSSASGNTNEVVIGYDVVGAGSNTVSIGNSATTHQKLYGRVDSDGLNSSVDATINGVTVGRGAGGFFSNTAAGFQALQNNTTGSENTASGGSALRDNTTGSENTATGRSALLNNTTGSENTASGRSALLYNTEGIGNTAAGFQAFFGNTTGNNNAAYGYRAGRYAGSGTVANETSNNSLYLGYLTRASASGNTNEVVIGYNVVGAGSNTSTIGNSDTTLAKLFGNTLQLTSSRTPASATASGAAGEICWDADFLYICIAPNTWRRIAHSSW